MHVRATYDFVTASVHCLCSVCPGLVLLCAKRHHTYISVLHPTSRYHWSHLSSTCAPPACRTTDACTFFAGGTGTTSHLLLLFCCHQFDLRAATLARQASGGSACSRGTTTLYHSPSATPNPIAA